MRADIFVHPTYDSDWIGTSSEAAATFEAAMLNNVDVSDCPILLTDPEIGPFASHNAFAKVIETENQFRTYLGDGRLPGVEDIQRLVGITLDSDELFIHGAYLELCVKNFAEQLMACISFYDDLPLIRFGDVLSNASGVTVFCKDRIRRMSESARLTSSIRDLVGKDTVIHRREPNSRYRRVSLSEPV